MISGKLFHPDMLAFVLLNIPKLIKTFSLYKSHTEIKNTFSLYKSHIQVILYIHFHYVF